MDIRDRLARLAVPAELRTNDKPAKQRAKAARDSKDRAQRHKRNVARNGDRAGLPLDFEDD